MGNRETGAPLLVDSEGLLSVWVVEMLIWVVKMLVRDKMMSGSAVMILGWVVATLVSRVEGVGPVTLIPSVEETVIDIGADDDSSVGWGNPEEVERFVVSEGCGRDDDELGMNVFKACELGRDVLQLPFPLPLPLPKRGNSESSLSSSSKKSSSSLLSILPGDCMRRSELLRANLRLIVASLVRAERGCQGRY